MSELRRRGYEIDDEDIVEDVPHRLTGLIVEGVNDPFILKAIFTAGGPGSGKSFVSDQMVRGLGLKVVNSDEPLERYLKQAQLPMIMAPEDPELYSKQIVQREKAKDLMKRAQKVWEKGLLGLLIDGTGKDAHKIIAAKNRLKEMGYDTAMIFVNAPLEMALTQNAQRERQVAPDVVKNIWKGVQANIGPFSQEFGPANFFLIDRKGGRLEGTAEQLWGQQLRRVGMKWLQKPLENPRGQAIVKQLRSTGGKSRDDLPKNFVPLPPEYEETEVLRRRSYLGEES
jgi:dephospho-CoA kinase